jgi:RNA polymerase sigma-70 factor (ECF subfamily)
MNQDIDKNLTQTHEVQDKDLLRLIHEGDQEAFTQLYTRHLTTVYKRVAYLIPKNDIDDVTQEVFIAMMRSLKTFRGDSKFSTWLRVITNRQVANYYRKNKQTLQDSDIDQEDSWLLQKSARNQSTRELQDRKIFVQQSLMKIPDHYQEIILLRFVEGLKFQEIADLQGKSLDAVKSTFRRAIEALRTEIGDPDV